MSTGVLSKRWLFLYNLIVLVITVSIFFIIIYRYATDIPVFDDIEAFCLFLNQSISNSLYENIKLLFQYSGDHRIFLGRLFVLIYFNLFGILNFKSLLILGNLSLVGLLIVFAFIFKRFKLSFAFFFLIVILTFNIQSYSLTGLWLITLFQFQFFFFVYILACFVNLKNRYLNFFTYIILAIVLTFSHTSGFVIWVSLAFILYFRGGKKEFITFALLGSIFVGYYLKNGAAAAESQINFDSNYPKLAFAGIFGVLGSFFDVLPIHVFKDAHRAIIPSLVGFGSFAFLVYAFFKEFVFNNFINENRTLRIILLGTMTYCIAVALMVGVLRSTHSPYHFLELSPHYRPLGAFYFSLFLTYCISLNSSKVQSWFLKLIAPTIILIFGISTYLRLDNLHNYHSQNKVYAENQIYNGAGLAGSIKSSSGALTFEIMKTSKELGVFELKSNENFRKIYTEIDQNTQLPEIQYDYLSKDDLRMYFLVQFENMNYKHPEDGLYLILKSNSSKWIFNFKKELKPKLNLFKIPESNKFFAVVDESLVDKGEFQSYVASIQGDKIEIFKGDKVSF